MIRAGNELMKLVREQLDLSQGQLADHLHMTQRTVSRIETGKRDLGVWEYFALMEMAGTPTEDLSLLTMESKEIRDYNAYKELKRLLRDERHNEIRDILPEFEKGLISKQPFILQFVAFVKVFVDEGMSHEQKIEELHKILQMSIKEFGDCDISTYRLTYNEIYIIFVIAMNLDSVGRVDCAINLYKAVVKSRGNALATDSDKAILFPALMFNLSTLLGKSGRYKEALSYCNDALGISKKYDKLRLIPYILHNMASCYRLMGEEEHIYMTYLIRAYHTAHALGNMEVVETIKSEAEKFGFTNI